MNVRTDEIIIGSLTKSTQHRTQGHTQSWEVRQITEFRGLKLSRDALNAKKDQKFSILQKSAAAIS